MLFRARFVVPTAFCLFVLAACGGGGGGGGGDPLESPSWRSATLLESDDTGNAESPAVAVDGNGNAIAVWQQSDGSHTNIWAARRNGSTRIWGAPVLLENDDSGHAGHAQVAFDGNGNAWAVWQQSDGTRYNILASRYDAAAGTWAPAALIESDNSGHASDPRLAIAANGNVFVTWRQWDGVQENIWANRYSGTPGSWGTAQVIETDSGSAYAPDVAVDGSGNAVVVWYQHDGVRYNILANRFDATSGNWGAATLIENDDAGDAGSPRVAFDTSGNALAIWEQSDGALRHIRSARFNAATSTWGTAVDVENDVSVNAQYPKIGFDGVGNAIAVWGQSDGDIWSARWTAASGSWGVAGKIEADESYMAASVQVAINASGDAVAVWQQTDGSGIWSIWSNRYDGVSGKWGVATEIETDDTGDAIWPRVAMDDTDGVVAVWFQSDGSVTSIFANQYY